MAIRVAMIGYGAVGSIHAAQLQTAQEAEIVSVYGPHGDKAAAFASTHGIARVCPTIAEALSGAQVAIVCSPSAAHFSQTCECLEQGIHTLVEMPPCANATQAEELRTIAQRRGAMLGCAHTSRFVTPYAQVKDCLTAGLLGEIQAIHYVRYHKLRDRSWRDDALLHHSAHPIDLALFWCGGLEPQGCVAMPDIHRPQTVSALAKLPSGGAASITVSYASRIYHHRMTVVGEKHTLETDGFSYLKSDLPEVQFRGNEQETYEGAISSQDAEFLQACLGKGSYVSWGETIRVLRAIDGFRARGTSTFEVSHDRSDAP